MIEEREWMAFTAMVKDNTLCQLRPRLRARTELARCETALLRKALQAILLREAAAVYHQRVADPDSIPASLFLAVGEFLLACRGANQRAGIRTPPWICPDNAATIIEETILEIKTKQRLFVAGLTGRHSAL